MRLESGISLLRPNKSNIEGTLKEPYAPADPPASARRHPPADYCTASLQFVCYSM